MQIPGTVADNDFAADFNAQREQCTGDVKGIRFAAGKGE